MASADIKYLNKDFTSLKQALIDYAKTYYPTAYNDFSVSSPGTMFIDMASYVGDVLSFYLDNQIQESFLEFAKQETNLYALAYMLGYRPKITSAAATMVDIYQQVPSTIVNGVYQPDFTYALTIEAGTQIQSNVNTSVKFYLPEKIDFTLSSSIDPTEITVYDFQNTQPNRYLLRKRTQALSGEVRTKTFSFGQPQRFPTITLTDANIIEIISITDSTSNERWYEVPYLAQDYILEPVTNTAANYPSLAQYSNQVPYMLRKVEVPKRFTSRFKSNSTLVIEFGAGINNVSSSAIIPNPFNIGIGTINGLTQLNTAYDPTNFVTTEDYGIAPNNTTLTVSYLVGGGAISNVQANELTVIDTVNASYKGNPGANSSVIKSTLAVTNLEPAAGGGDGDDTESIRLNAAAQFPSQLRAVTQQDYLGVLMSMPSKFGQVAKAYVTKDENVFRPYVENQPAERDPLATTIYLTAYDDFNRFTDPTPALYTNIQTYMEQYRMLTDVINLKPAYIINLGINFDIVLRPDYTSRDVLARALAELKSYFDRSKWQINQPIILSEIYTLIDRVQGVQTVQKVEVVNLTGEADGYSRYSYDISAATLNGIIYPSLDPSIFEVRYPDTDIQGRVVTTM